MADPLDIIARICCEQPSDALEQIACALGYTPEREPRFAATAVRVKRSGGPKKITVRVPDESPLWDLPAGTVTRLYLIPDGVRVDAPTLTDAQVEALLPKVRHRPGMVGYQCYSFGDVAAAVRAALGVNPSRGGKS